MRTAAGTTAARTFLRQHLLAAATAAALALAAAPAAHAHDLTLSFDMRTISSRTWEGTVAQDLSGTVVMRVRGRGGSERRRVTTTWTVDAGESSFTAQLRGVINLRTRRVRLDGSVESGSTAGAEAHARGRVATARRKRLTGTLTLVPHHARATQLPLRATRLET